MGRHPEQGNPGVRAEGITLLVSINGHVRTRALGLKNTKHFGTGGAIAGTWLEWRAPFRKTMTLPTATMISRVDLCRGPMLVRKSPGASRHFCMDLWRRHWERSISSRCTPASETRLCAEGMTWLDEFNMVLKDMTRIRAPCTFNCVCDGHWSNWLCRIWGGIGVFNRWWLP